ncbi:MULTISPECIES: Asp-tRNA(Asn)/Glu-tRNA(Gln) amidotransferase subunit GatA [Malaciobacter]|uniref:Glutamyl-tRNA(Gln) amidotransferase subunit A n=2 Tax=Malaciobacter TaxID=2321114 RepID=A0AB36ZWU4_9BACT|nr:MULTISPECIES: Asp-tRNA(Asn)/Glu-tRNA(Gln) amidotransferase subunit GatA [Malaciobacter]PHO10192.1 Asp-tRNA(Asn)/Glu-tRNA(Gln) amidotransferase GatCAB subunit A [Malaciobacter canalis]PPK62179.1 aspartyl/glutamyl-tRNA(Asn/Gln) amidotransferase subunit A [Malaciobacter marinus]QEE32683.1 Glu-tRNA(Gln) amidotransferase, subunit A [Malaciobacter canalis]
MITLKEALQLSSEEIKDLRKDLNEKIKQSNIGAYVEQLTNSDISICGEGIPIAIKDNINVKDWEITCSSNILKNYISPYNATVIDNLIKANLSPFGRTNMDEFAMGSSTESSCYGKTLNPIDNNKVPGGSSGGSAAAVAGGIAIAALGTDTGGSIRQPAAYCGCVGMKPTYGRVSRYGITAYSSSLDQCGPITQNVEDAAILYDIISGNDPMDSTSLNIEYPKVSQSLNSDKKLTIAVIENFIEQASDEVKKGFNKAVDALKEAGHTIVYKNMVDTSKILSSYYIVATAEASANLSRFDGVRYGNRKGDAGLKDMYTQTKSQGFGHEVQKRILLGSFVLSSGYYDAYYIKAQKVRHLIKDEYETIFKEADLILSPVSPTTAVEFGSFKTSLDMYLSDIYTISVNLAGLPAISLPVDKDSSGMPVGVQLIGKAYDEQTMFDGALSLEKCVNYKK